MKAIPDYSVLKSSGHTILCIGGATSIDRQERQEVMWLNKLRNREERKCYWENEIPVFNDTAFCEIVKSDLHIDTVVTHTAPSFCHPSGKGGWVQYFRGSRIYNTIDRLDKWVQYRLRYCIWHDWKKQTETA